MKSSDNIWYENSNDFCFDLSEAATSGQLLLIYENSIKFLLESHEYNRH